MTICPICNENTAVCGGTETNAHTPHWKAFKLAMAADGWIKGGAPVHLFTHSGNGEKFQPFEMKTIKGKEWVMWHYYASLGHVPTPF